jgi:hypothetical protein
MGLMIGCETNVEVIVSNNKSRLVVICSNRSHFLILFCHIRAIHYSIVKKKIVSPFRLVTYLLEGTLINIVYIISYHLFIYLCLKYISYTILYIYFITLLSLIL